MKLAVVVRRLSSKGGLEQNVLALTEHLARHHQVHVICQRAEAATMAQLHPVSAPGWLGEGVRQRWFARSAQRALASLSVANSYTGGRVPGVRVVRLEGGLAQDWLAHQPSYAEKVAVELEQATLRQAHKVVVLSAAMGARVAQLGVPPDKICLIRNGLDLARYHPTSKSEARKKWRLQAPTVAFVGRGFYRKGLDLLLAAVPAGWHVLIAGEDRQGAEWIAAAQKRGVQVHALGWCDVRPVLAAADLLALPARYEPFGLVVLEALAFGLPVVCTATVGASEIVPHPQLVTEPEALHVALQDAWALAQDPQTAVICRQAAEKWPLSASLAALQAVLEQTA